MLANRELLDAVEVVVQVPYRHAEEVAYLITGCEFSGVHTLPPLAVWQAKSGGCGWGRQNNTRHAEAAGWMQCA